LPPGSSIIATSNQCAATLVFDTETASLAMGNPLPDALRNALNFFVTAGDDVLIAFAYYFMRQPHSFEVMTTAKDDMRPLCPSTDWSWKSMPTPPFAKSERIKSYALHPDGRTVFVSAASGDFPGGTFSFDTKNCEWRRLGEWMLPFQLQGYYDGDLDRCLGWATPRWLHLLLPSSIPQQQRHSTAQLEDGQGAQDVEVTT
jgi:hypothetical protein